MTRPFSIPPLFVVQSIHTHAMTLFTTISVCFRKSQRASAKVQASRHARRASYTLKQLANRWDMRRCHIGGERIRQLLALYKLAGSMALSALARGQGMHAFVAIKSLPAATDRQASLTHAQAHLFSPLLPIAAACLGILRRHVGNQSGSCA